ncbi:Transcription factor VIP1-like protein [Drosera capensis]
MDQPQRGSLHRRAHSDTAFFNLPQFSDDDLLFSDIDAFDIRGAGDGGGGVPMAVDSEESSGGGGGGGHFRSLSVDADFFEGLEFEVDGGGGMGRRGEWESGEGGGGGRRKAAAAAAAGVVSGEKLAEIALMDPKRAKRILANRQSAARSKEKKLRYTTELEKKVQKLETEATSLSSQVTILQRDTTGLTVENRELKLRLQALEQQAQLRDALHEALREEVQRLRVASDQVRVGAGDGVIRGSTPQLVTLASSWWQQTGTTTVTATPSLDGGISYEQPAHP